MSIDGLLPEELVALLTAETPAYLLFPQFIEYATRFMR